MQKRRTPIHETAYICATLATVSGFLETYTYLLKGGVFANAQTGNFALLGMAIAHCHCSRSRLMGTPVR